MNKSNRRNPLEREPALSRVEGWSLSEEDFTRRVKKTSEVSETSEVLRAYKSAREETMSVTEDIVHVESEIDERVKGLYGL
ncbi:MAG: hypothetical protein M3R47_17770 [Chloroflexota bacterium]|nr:hypothetical protein [Chloroflexota bacterium]